MLNVELPSRSDAVEDTMNAALSDWSSSSPGYNLPTQQERDTTIREVKSNCSCFIKFGLAVLLTGLLIFIIVDLLTNRYIEKGISNFLEWVEQNPGIGFVAFIGVYYVCTRE